MSLPKMIIEHMTPEIPIMQGGMGIRVSLSGLAAAVANAVGVYKKFTENKDKLKFAYEIIYAFFYFYFNIKYDVSIEEIR